VGCFVDGLLGVRRGLYANTLHTTDSRVPRVDTFAVYKGRVIILPYKPSLPGWNTTYFTPFVFDWK
jgi:hypothetical protein